MGLGLPCLLSILSLLALKLIKIIFVALKTPNSHFTSNVYLSYRYEGWLQSSSSAQTDWLILFRVNRKVRELLESQLIKGFQRPRVASPQVRKCGVSIGDVGSELIESSRPRVIAEARNKFVTSSAQILFLSQRERNLLLTKRLIFNSLVMARSSKAMRPQSSHADQNSVTDTRYFFPLTKIPRLDWANEAIFRKLRNRISQRAFRARQSGYIKELEEKLQRAENPDLNITKLEEENQRLRGQLLNCHRKLESLIVSMKTVSASMSDVTAIEVRNYRCLGG